MAEVDNTPSFNIKVVVQETGLKPVTLRAWERRYGMPSPERSPGGHRLYSQHEIDMLKWLVARQEEGLSISHAIELWQNLEEEGKDPLQEIPLSPPPLRQISPVKGDTTADLRSAWVEACLQFDEHNAQRILAQAFAIFSIETVCFELLQKGLHEIGEGWYAGEVTVQQEHFASALALRQLESLLAAAPPPTREDIILVACPPQEQHTFAPLLLTLLLRRRGWDVVYLGANVPVERLENVVKTVEPKLVIMSAQTLHTAGTLVEVASFLQKMETPLAFGGMVFNTVKDTREHIAGHFLGEDMRTAVRTVEELMYHVPATPEVESPSPAYQQAHAHYRTRRAAVEAYVVQQVDLDKMTARELANANDEMAHNIEAALALGDMDLINANIDWIHGLLSNYHHHMPEEAMRDYMAAYHQGLRENLVADGKPIVEWFEEQANQDATTT